MLLLTVTRTDEGSDGVHSHVSPKVQTDTEAQNQVPFPLGLGQGWIQNYSTLKPPLTGPKPFRHTFEVLRSEQYGLTRS